MTWVRVFTRITSDNPWCSLLAICSLRWKYNVTFTHWIPNHSWPEWITIKRFFLKWLWNLLNFKKTFQTYQSATYLLGKKIHIQFFIQNLNFLSSMIFTYKLLKAFPPKGLLPDIFNNTWQAINIHHKHTENKYGKLTSENQGIVIWNSIPIEIRNLKTIKKTKTKLYKYILNTILL